jgi:hypothetical protein
LWLRLRLWPRLRRSASLNLWSRLLLRHRLLSWRRHHARLWLWPRDLWFYRLRLRSVLRRCLLFTNAPLALTTLLLLSCPPHLLAGDHLLTRGLALSLLLLPHQLPLILLLWQCLAYALTLSRRIYSSLCLLLSELLLTQLLHLFARSAISTCRLASEICHLAFASYF